MDDKPIVIVHAKYPLTSDTAEAIDTLLDAILAKDEYRDMLGVPRIGREPDFRNGRWCVHCSNSLPMEWTGPCDVCGGRTGHQSQPAKPCESYTIWPSTP